MMSEPPNWDDMPPPDDAGSTLANRGAQPQRRPPVEAGDAAKLASEFYSWLSDRNTHAQLTTVLPDKIEVAVFIEAAKTAVLTNPKLLALGLRQSLLLAVSNAAGMGLLPNGKQGALVMRWDRDKGEHVVWQPMVWGIVKLGRETGAIKAIRSVIVFQGEHVEIDEVANTIAHRRGPAELSIVEEAYASMIGPGDQKGKQNYLPDQFLDRIALAYCIITANDGTQIMRWMTGARIKMVRNSSPAKWGPWAGAFMDEMVSKTIMLWTTKLVDLDPTSASARRFQAALETDMHIDFDREGQPVTMAEQDHPRALAAPGTKLDRLGEAISRAKEPVPREDGNEPPDPAENPPKDDPPPKRNFGTILAEIGTRLTEAKARHDVDAILATREAEYVTKHAAGLAAERWNGMVKIALDRTDFPGDTPIE